MNGYLDGSMIRYTRTRNNYACAARLFDDRIYFSAVKGSDMHFEDYPYDPATWDNEFYEFCMRIEGGE